MTISVLISLAIVIADRVTKLAALRHLADHRSIPVIPNVFHFSLVENPGIAFGLFGSGSYILTSVIIVCLGALIVLAYQMRNGHLIQKVSVSFILGGAIGNLTDRFLYGHVIDFLDFRVWPVFNLADMFITAGVFIFILFSLRKA